ncbi:MAG: RtcB family protein, partial [Polyangiales bacterium]
WARALDPRALTQLLRIANRPWAYGFVAAMADAHVSEGVAVGTVFATEHTVVPHALGGDLGCGMSATKLSVDARALDLHRVLDALTAAIPAGSATHHGRGVDVPDALFEAPLSTRALEHTREALARRHLGTLGGGNHFLELDVDVEGNTWLLVHSGSRGLGAAIAAHHAKAGETLDVREPAGAAYLRDLEWALAFAAHNRRTLAKMAVSVIAEIAGTPCEFDPVLDIHHNFAAREEWLGRTLVVHRKGAVAVPKGRLALVPGSMGTASYVVEGLGNEASFGSCSHGAGRVMTRTEARARVKPEALDRAMRRVVHPRSRALVEEAPCVYRDIREVLEDQEDLVTRLLRLEPIAVLKG